MVMELSSKAPSLEQLPCLDSPCSDRIFDLVRPTLDYTAGNGIISPSTTLYCSLRWNLLTAGLSCGSSTANSRLRNAFPHTRASRRAGRASSSATGCWRALQPGHAGFGALISRRFAVRPHDSYPVNGYGQCLVYRSEGWSLVCQLLGSLPVPLVRCGSPVGCAGRTDGCGEGRKTDFGGKREVERNPGRRVKWYPPGETQMACKLTARARV
jgi:hypothetical protein